MEKQPASATQKTVVAVIIAALGAIGVSVSISDSSPFAQGCASEQASEPAPAGAGAAGAPSLPVAGSLANDQDAGAE